MWPPLSHFQGLVTGLLGLDAINFVMWPLLRQVRGQGLGSSKCRNTQFRDVATFEPFLRQGYTSNRAGCTPFCDVATSEAGWSQGFHLE